MDSVRRVAERKNARGLTSEIEVEVRDLLGGIGLEGNLNGLMGGSESLSFALLGVPGWRNENDLGLVSGQRACPEVEEDVPELLDGRLVLDSKRPKLVGVLRASLVLRRLRCLRDLERLTLLETSEFRGVGRCDGLRDKAN